MFRNTYCCFCTRYIRLDLSLHLLLFYSLLLILIIFITSCLVECIWLLLANLVCIEHIMIELLQKYVKNDGAVVVRQARSERKYDSLARRPINSNGFPYSTRSLIERGRGVPRPASRWRAAYYLRHVPSPVVVMWNSYSGAYKTTKWPLSHKCILLWGRSKDNVSYRYLSKQFGGVQECNRQEGLRDSASFCSAVEIAFSYSLFSFPSWPPVVGKTLTVKAT